MVIFVQIAQSWISCMISVTDDISAAIDLCATDTVSFYVGILHGEIIGSAIANPVADDTFHASRNICKETMLMHLKR